MKVDFHTHHYPLAYLDEIERHPSPACSVTRDASGQRLVQYAGDFNVVAPGHIDLEARLAEMERTGVDMAVLTLTTPGVHVEERARGIYLAQIVNDSFAQIQQQSPQRFCPLATSTSAIAIVFSFGSQTGRVTPRLTLKLTSLLVPVSASMRSTP